MYKKVVNKKPHRNRFCIPCYIDGRFYPSLLAASIDFELGYANLHKQMCRHQGPFKVSNHTIVLQKWLLVHPEYQLEEPGELPEGE